MEGAERAIRGRGADENKVGWTRTRYELAGWPGEQNEKEEKVEEDTETQLNFEFVAIRLRATMTMISRGHD